MKMWFQAVCISLTLVACSTVPNDIGGNVDPSITLTRVRADQSLAQGQLVRWGGLIARVQNKEGQTWIEIVEKPLTHYGQPVDANVTNGRFIAIFDRFLDPMVFQLGREVTVMGSLQPAVEGKIDEQPYHYAVIAASGFHLWQPRADRHYDDVMIMRGGFWDPWWYRPVYIHHHVHTAPRPRVTPPPPTSTLPPTITTRPPRATNDDERRIHVPREDSDNANQPRPPRGSNDDKKENKKR